MIPLLGRLAAVALSRSGGGGAAVTLKVNDYPIRTAIGELAKGLKDTSRPNREISVRLLRWALRNYNSSGSLVGGWAPLAESTRLQKKRLGYSTKPLAPRTGALRSGFTPFSDARTAGVRNPVSYARFHNTGTERLPQRRLLPTTKEGEAIAVEVYTKHLQQAAERAAAKAASAAGKESK